MTENRYRAEWAELGRELEPRKKYRGGTTPPLAACLAVVVWFASSSILITALAAAATAGLGIVAARSARADA
jgi:hypothetical protein